MWWSKKSSSRQRQCLLPAVASLPLTMSVLGMPLGDDAAPTSTPAIHQQDRSASAVPPLSPLAELTPGQMVNGASTRSRLVPLLDDKGAFSASSLAESDIPWTAVQAYKRAAGILAEVRPGCQIPWTLLAAIGRVESDHGRHGEALLGADGVSDPLLVGVALDGVGPVAAIPDSDEGQFDQDQRWDRAVGPMQFIPTTWAVAGVDADADGVRSPHDIDDAALAAAVYLCAGEDGSIREPAAMRAAIYSYNHSDSYVTLVMAFERGYRAGYVEVAAPPSMLIVTLPALDYGRGTLAEVETSVAVVAKRKHKLPTATPGDETVARDAAAGPTPKGPVDAVPAPKPNPTSEPKPGPAPAPTPDPLPEGTPAPDPTPPPPDPTPLPDPTPPPDPTPAPDPTPPSQGVVSISGVWNVCIAGFCLGNDALDLGPADRLDTPAAGDFDGDDVVEPNGVEFAGLVGTSVTLVVERQSASWIVYAINDKAYRFADGTFAPPKPGVLPPG